MGQASCIRRCAACGRRAPADALLRFVAGDEGPEADPQRRRGGRGAHLCPTPTCAQKAAKRFALHRVLRLRPAPDQTRLKPQDRAAVLLEHAAQALHGATHDELRRLERTDLSDGGPVPLGNEASDVIDPSVLARPGRVARRLRSHNERLRSLRSQPRHAS